MGTLADKLKGTSGSGGQTLASKLSAPVATPTQEPSLSQKIWNGLSGIVSSVEQPFISLAATPVQAGVRALGLKDPYAQGIPAGLPGADTKAPVSPLTVKAKSGDILKAGATIGAFATAPANLPAALGTGAAVGAATGAGQALQEDKSLRDIAVDTAIGGAVGGVTGGAVYGLGKLLQAAGDKIQTSIIKPSKVDIEDGFSLDTLKKYNLGGSLETTHHRTQAALNDLTTQLKVKLADADTSVNLNDVFSQTVKELTDESKLKGFGANTKIANTLQQLKQEITSVGDIQSVPDAQIIKQAAGQFGAWQYGKVDPDSKATEIVFNTFYNKLKTAIEQGSPEGVKQINQELSKLIPVMNAVVRRLPIAQRSNAISLNEMIGLVGSSVNPIALGPTILAILSRSGRFGNLLSKLGPNVSSASAPAAFTTSKLAEPISDIVQGQ